MMAIQTSLVKDGATYTTFDAPGANNGTFASGINDAGQIVGFFEDSSGLVHGFLKDGATYTTLDVPVPSFLRRPLGSTMPARS
jgi:probable HAF family extracellular repeat protein